MQAEAQQQEIEETTSVEIEDDSAEVIVEDSEEEQKLSSDVQILMMFKSLEIMNLLIKKV